MFFEKFFNECVLVGRQVFIEMKWSSLNDFSYQVIDYKITNDGVHGKFRLITKDFDGYEEFGVCSGFFPFDQMEQMRFVDGKERLGFDDIPILKEDKTPLYFD